MSAEIITLTVSACVPHTDRMLSSQTQFRAEQIIGKPTLVMSEIARLQLAVREEVKAATEPVTFRKDGKLFVRRI